MSLLFGILTSEWLFENPALFIVGRRKMKAGDEPVLQLAQS